MTTKAKSSTVNLVELERFVDALNRQQIKKVVLENLFDAYKIQIPIYTPADLCETAAAIEKRASKASIGRTTQDRLTEDEYWFLGEKSLFFCVFGYYAFLNQINIEAFTETQILPLQKIFCSKSVKMLFFQAKHLLSLVLKTQWLQQDINLLEDIMRWRANRTGEHGYSVKWKKVAYQLFLRSETGDFYSARDCRNLWLSHLSPDINKKSWKIDEEIQLCKLVLEYGCKWSFVSRKMGSSRTEHMVKNKINSLIKANFRKKFKSITQKHIIKILQQLQKKQELKIEEQMVCLSTNTIISNQQEQQEAESIDSRMNLKQTSMSEFEAPFSLSRLVVVGMQQNNWEYDEKSPCDQYSCFLSLN